MAMSTLHFLDKFFHKKFGNNQKPFIFAVPFGNEGNDSRNGAVVQLDDLWALFFLFRATLKTNKFPKQTKLSYQIVTEKKAGKGQEQGGQAMPKVENVPKPDITASDYIHNPMITGRLGFPERREGHGMKM